MKYKHTKKQWIKWFGQKNKLLEENYKKVSKEEFYRELFPTGSLQERGKKDNSKGNAMVDIVTFYHEHIKYSQKYVMTDELGALKYLDKTDKSNETSRMCLCSPVSYYGKHKSNNMAHELFAVTLDLDYLGLQQLKNVIKQIGNGMRCIPPNYIVNSGRGLHFYYLLQQPLPCYGYFVSDLTQFKSVLQDFTWNQTTSLYPDKPDHGSITQAFRMVGSETKLGSEYRVTAYKVRDEKWTIEELYQWVMDRAPSFLKNCPMPRIKQQQEFKKDKKTYEPNRWECKEDLYQWWIRQIKDKAIVGGRYYTILALAAYGSKCGIEFERIRKDAMQLLPHLEGLTNDETNHFTKSDIRDALSFYKNNKDNMTFKLTRERITELTKIEIKPTHREKGKRLKQKDHLELARMSRDIRQRVNGTKWTDNNGRPSQQQIVNEWQQQHPEGRKIDCIRDTGLSKPTVYKWWNCNN